MNPASGAAPILGEQALREAADRGMELARGDEVETLTLARTRALTRFANNVIHQNVTATNVDLRVRIVRDRRVASVWTSRPDAEGIRVAARHAWELAGAAAADPDWSGLPVASPSPRAGGFWEGTPNASPEARARAVRRMTGLADAAGLSAAGYVATTINEVAVANSHGTWAYHAGTVAEAEIIAAGASGSAYASRVHGDFAAIDPEAVAREAIEGAKRAQGPRDLPPGTYEVVLAPYAVADIVAFLSQQLTGLALEEGRSFVGGRLGDLVMSPAVTLVDDPTDSGGLPRPFDFEGVPSERLLLIERGVARDVAYDSRTAGRNGVRNTGHALPTPTATPLATHIRLEPGGATREELIAGVERGLLVTRFWYTRWVHPLRTIVTGMTRDGTFAIERGEVAYPVRNLRFTQSYHEALGGTVALERELTLQRRDLWDFDAGSTRVPALHLAAFAFTGATRD